MPAHRLELEITETALVRDMNRALATLRQLKTLGVRIAMDDFGTGYSSLSNLRAFPFDKIKIDGSFIRSVDSNDEAATIVRAVLGLGRGLGLPVLAEGVETAGELAFLAAEFCTQGQGYFLGRPARSKTIAIWSAARAVPPSRQTTARRRRSRVGVAVVRDRRGRIFRREAAPLPGVLRPPCRRENSSPRRCRSRSPD